MNKYMIGAGSLIMLLSAASAAEPVTKSRVWTETFPVQSAAPHLKISNIWGTVRVRPGPTGQITVTVDETRSAPDQDRFDRSLQIIQLDIDADTNGVTINVGDPSSQWYYNVPCRGCRADYQFDVVVPSSTILDVGTVLDGTIDVSGVAGTISASNVNGPINAHELRDCEMLHSVNGELDVSFTLAPGQDCAIETINGDITIALPSGSGLDVALDQFNGRMISEFAVDPFVLPAVVEHSTDNGGHRYRIQQSAGIRLEGGGPIFSISSLNGDVKIQKTQ